MTNQAAQTMPELPEPLISGGNDNSRPDLGRGCTGYTAAQVQQYAIDYAAALALSRGVPADMVLVPVEPTHEMIDASMDVLPTMHALLGRKVYAAMLAAAPAAAGAQGEVPQRAEFDYVDISNRVQHATGKSVFPSTVKAILTVAGSIAPQPAAADGGVRERARELLASDCPECGGSNGYMVPAGEYAGAWQKCGTCQDGERLQSVNRYQALRAIEAALSSHRQAGDVNGLWPSIPSIQRWKMERGSDGHRWSVYMDHCELGEWCKWEEVQQAWFCQALALRNAAPPPGPNLSKFRELAETFLTYANRELAWARNPPKLGGGEASSESYSACAAAYTHCATAILALVEKGAGNG